MNDNRTSWTKAIFFLLLFLSIIIGFSILKIMADVIKPVVVAVLLSFVFFPVIKKINRKFKLPWTAGILIVFVLFFGMFFGIGNILAASFKSILASSSEYIEKFNSISKSISETIKANKNLAIFNFISFNDELSFFENIQSSFNIAEVIKNFALGFTETVFTFSKMMFLVILLSIFLLIEMNLSPEKLSSALGAKYGTRAIRMMKTTATDITRYVSIKFVMSVLTGVLVTIVCFAFKMNFAVIWGFLSFIMNFIPTFGSIIAWVITTIFALIEFYPSPVPILMISIIVILLNVVIGNVVEPKIAGKGLDVSPFVILVSLSVWGWIWGLLGLLLAVPLLVIIKIICENISFLHPIAFFLGNKNTPEKTVNEQN